MKETMAVQRGQIAHEESDWPQLKGWSCSDILPSSTYLSVSVYVHVGEGACLEVKDKLRRLSTSLEIGLSLTQRSPIQLDWLTGKP